MKQIQPWIKFTVIVFSIGVITTLFLQNNSDADALKERLGTYEQRADSLRTAVMLIDHSVRHKDSILLVYLASLDKTLEELNKESAKNRKSIEANFVKQDSIRAAFCREMASLNQHPEECH